MNTNKKQLIIRHCERSAAVVVRGRTVNEPNGWNLYQAAGANTKQQAHTA